jgi:hypothetical protein
MSDSLSARRLLYQTPGVGMRGHEWMIEMSEIPEREDAMERG